MKYIKTFEQSTTEITEIEELEALEDKYKIEQIEGLYKIKLNDITSKVDKQAVK